MITTKHISKEFLEIWDMSFEEMCKRWRGLKEKDMSESEKEYNLKIFELEEGKVYESDRYRKVYIYRIFSGVLKFRNHESGDSWTEATIIAGVRFKEVKPEKEKKEWVLRRFVYKNSCGYFQCFDSFLLWDEVYEKGDKLLKETILDRGYYTEE